MYSELDVYFDGGMWGLLGGYYWIVVRKFPWMRALDAV
jgi:hypothetical protein